MMKKKNALVAATAVLLALLQTSASAATGEITLSGSTWTGKVDGSTKYTGTDLFACANACINAMSSGTVNLRNSGSQTVSGGALKQIILKSSITFSGNNCDINCASGDDWLIPIKATSKSNVRTQYLKAHGRIRYGIKYESCKTQSIQDCSFAACNSPFFRADGNGGTSFSAYGVQSSGGRGDQAFGLETNNQSGVNVGTAWCTSTPGCGVCLNTSSSCSISTINSTRCCYGGSYAGWRNCNNKSTTCGTVNSTSCGRGVVFHHNTQGHTVNWANVQSGSSYGILFYSSQSDKVYDGSVQNNGGRGVQLTYDSAQCNNNLIQGIDTNDGITEGSGNDYNTFKNCNLHGSGLTIVGPHSVSSGNTL